MAGVRTRVASSQSLASVIESGTRWHPAGNTSAMPMGSWLHGRVPAPFSGEPWLHRPAAGSTSCELRPHSATELGGWDRAEPSWMAADRAVGEAAGPGGAPAVSDDLEG